MISSCFNTYFVFAFPLLLTIGILVIPVVKDYTNHELATQATKQTLRWFGGHILSAFTFGLGLILQGSSLLRTELFKGVSLYLIFIAALVFIGSSAIPSGYGLYIIATVVLLVYLPIDFVLIKLKG